MKTLEERMEAIRNKAKKDADDATAKLNAEDAKRKELISQINSLSDRIKAILTLANECVRMNVKIPQRHPMDMNYETAKVYGYLAEFIAEGIYHHTGLIRSCSCGSGSKEKYEWIGIDNGGACGRFDFHTNGDQVFAIHEEERFHAEPRICDMEKFLREFPVFEAAFYNWIDSLQ